MLRGGLRDRLVADSFRIMVIAALEDIGWFNPNRRHEPIAYIKKPSTWEEPVARNSFSIGPEDVFTREAGLGNQPLDRTRMYVDFFAEDEIVGAHFAHDVRDILLGKVPSAGRTGPELDVFDLRQATPSILSTCDIETVQIDRTVGDVPQWMTHWFVVSCMVEDEYLDELPEDGRIDLFATEDWQVGFQEALDLIRSVE